MIEDVLPTLAFRRIEAVIILIDRDGATDHVEFDLLLESVESRNK